MAKQDSHKTTCAQDEKDFTAYDKPRTEPLKKAYKDCTWEVLNPEILRIVAELQTKFDIAKTAIKEVYHLISSLQRCRQIQEEKIDAELRDTREKIQRKIKDVADAYKESVEIGADISAELTDRRVKNSNEGPAKKEDSKPKAKVLEVSPTSSEDSQPEKTVVKKEKEVPKSHLTQEQEKTLKELLLIKEGAGVIEPPPSEKEFKIKKRRRSGAKDSTDEDEPIARKGRK